MADIGILGKGKCYGAICSVDNRIIYCTLYLQIENIELYDRVWNIVLDTRTQCQKCCYDSA